MSYQHLCFSMSCTHRSVQVGVNVCVCVCGRLTVTPNVTLSSTIYVIDRNHNKTQNVCKTYFAESRTTDADSSHDLAPASSGTRPLDGLSNRLGWDVSEFQLESNFTQHCEAFSSQSEGHGIKCTLTLTGNLMRTPRLLSCIAVNEANYSIKHWRLISVER